ncbi:MAG: helix-turn-helix transcriptional regulator [Clostridia bacterium]|nr:helix-turn-helix transcriptional regulator [Clostridia bacterium]
MYETNVKKLRQPFLHSNFYLHIAFKGDAVLKFDGKEFPLKSGDVFFTFPNQSFNIDADDNFTYLYISFNGQGVLPLLNSLNINKENCVHKNFENILSFWMDAIRRVNTTNANILTESVLMYTLSFIDSTENVSVEEKKDKFDSILEYVNHNYTSKDMSIKKVADIFFYSEKYLSSLFVKKTKLKFSQYLNNLRISYAVKLFNKGEKNISEVAYKCGYTDQFYFSKVFKKYNGKTPSEYIKSPAI